MPNYGTSEDRTEIQTEGVRTAVNGLPYVATDMESIRVNLLNISEPLEATWIGPARDSYLEADVWARFRIEDLKTRITKLHNVVVQICSYRTQIDEAASDGAEGKLCNN